MDNIVTALYRILDCIDSMFRQVKDTGKLNLNSYVTKQMQKKQKFHVAI